jgi:hypothetical protein
VAYCREHGLADDDPSIKRSDWFPWLVKGHAWFEPETALVEGARFARGFGFRPLSLPTWPAPRRTGRGPSGFKIMPPTRVALVVISAAISTRSSEA